jgi:hypothetical protein
MENDQIKLAFSKVKQDIFYLTNEISSLKSELGEITTLLKSLHEEILSQKLKQIAQIPQVYPSIQQTDKPTDQQTNQHINQTYSTYPTHNPTHPQEIGGLKSSTLDTSIGNEGVPTDRQTDQQTDRQTDKSLDKNIKEASAILNSLDRLKKEIRIKFKKITAQEMTVFSTIYQLENQNQDEITYKKVADILRLSESSIRDYVQKIINKGIPIKKHKLNNKKILLSISSDLKKIASLNTIIQLREL